MPRTFHRKASLPGAISLSTTTTRSFLRSGPCPPCALSPLSERVSLLTSTNDHSSQIIYIQVAQACSSATCRTPAGVDGGGSYSYGLMVVLDWENGDAGTNTEHHAHFGGTPNIAAGWARRGIVMMIR